MKVLFAVKVGEPDYMEQLITEDESLFSPAKDWCTKNGFDRLREANIDLKTPINFEDTINK